LVRACRHMCTYVSLQKDNNCRKAQDTESSINHIGTCKLTAVDIFRLKRLGCSGPKNCVLAFYVWMLRNEWVDLRLFSCTTVFVARNCEVLINLSSQKTNSIQSCIWMYIFRSYFSDKNYALNFSFRQPSQVEVTAKNVFQAHKAKWPETPKLCRKKSTFVS
jgi:hypothetical protein